MGCDALLLLRWPGSQIAFRLALLARPLHLVCQINRSRNVSPAFYYHSRCWWRWRSNVMSFMILFLEIIQLTTFCFLSVMQVRNLLLCRTNVVQTRGIRRTHPTAVFYDIRYSTIITSIAFSVQEAIIHPFIHPSRWANSNSNILIYSSLLPRKPFPCHDWSCPQWSFCCHRFPTPQHKRQCSTFSC